jgi:hypothetical protein
MPIPQHVKATIDNLERRIAKLTRLKDGLIEEFSEDGDLDRERRGKGGHAQATPSLFGGANTSKQRIVTFLETNGPAFRREIIKNSGVRAGTIAWALTDKNVFARRDDGRWEPKKPKEKTQTPSVA